MDQPSPRFPGLPSRIAGLAGIAANLAWSWDRGARALFRALDQPLWHRSRHNPIELLERMDPARLVQCAEDPEFLAQYDATVRGLAARLEGSATWFADAAGGSPAGPVAYFCAEFGLHNSVPIYSGGLGVLAGDHCKAASDLGVPLVGIGLFYVKGYFDQHLQIDGRQVEADERLNPGITPLTPVLGPGGEAHVATVVSCGRTVHVGAWNMMVGRVPIYLLDTDLESNDPADRELTHKLYAGGREMRLRQEWILGVGGVRVLRAVGVEPRAWHANEGHAAFMLIERLRELRGAGIGWEEAVTRVRAASVFTTHTPVPAGHDVFTFEQIDACIGPVWDQLGVERETFLRLGYHPTNDHHLFHMTVMALRLSGRVNGVAQLHGREARRLWASLWPGREPDRVPIGHVTNGVHLGTWMSHPMQDLLDEHFGLEWERRLDDPALWDLVRTLDEERLWAVHLRLKAVLLEFVREEARRRWRDHWEESAQLVGAGTLLASWPLTIGFARRFATYKRADLIFRDPDRLRRLLTDPARPVQILFAGKAHPADEPGKKVLQRVYSFTRDSSFEGRIGFVEDYEMHLAHRLVQGVDLWLNLPRAPMEACGTSGIKAALNGVPQLSTEDGWWAEGYTGKNGWMIPLAGPDDDVDGADAEHFYALLEREVVPLYYQRDERNIPLAWVERMKEALRVAGSRFTARRMVQEYVRGYYLPAMCGVLDGDDPPSA